MKGQKKMQLKYFLLTLVLCACANVPDLEKAEKLHKQGVAEQEKGNLTEALKLYEQSCRSGYKEVCWAVGRIYSEEPQYVDLKKAHYFFDKSCNLGFVGGCIYAAQNESRLCGYNNNLTELKEKELEECFDKKAVPNSLKYLQKACDLGECSGINAYNEYTEKSQRVNQLLKEQNKK